VIVGPTASGKSRLALDLARGVGGEIVSADSQQVYRGMDIGTGKATPAERALAPHHLLDVVDPDEPMTAARFVELADAAIAGAAARGRPVVVAGGTGLYVRALLLGLFAGPAGDPELRAQLVAEAEAAGGAPALWQRLAEVDPAGAARIERNDLRRIVRALEVLALTGSPISEHQRRHDHRAVSPRYPARLVGLCPLDRAELYRRIDARVDDMVAAGLLDEVRALRAAGYGPGLRSQAAIGYAEIHRHLDGTLDENAAIALAKRNSRRYARRQLSWYRGDESITWYPDPSAVAIADLERYLLDPRAS
jgi:tRNA dimethylallyltransferase